MLSEADAAARLERGGFRRSEAGDADFGVAVRILVALSAGSKGLILSGTFGCGKTTFVRAAFSWAECFTMPGSEWVLANTQQSADFTTETVVLDDVGSEHQAFVDCVRTEPFADFIMRRYQRFSRMTDGERRLFRTVITTNYDQLAFTARYGARVSSRIAEMCLAARFSGGDKRTWEVIR